MPANAPEKHGEKARTRLRWVTALSYERCHGEPGEPPRRWETDVVTFPESTDNYYDETKVAPFRNVDARLFEITWHPVTKKGKQVLPHLPIRKLCETSRSALHCVTLFCQP